jgi:hypothetical protein
MKKYTLFATIEVYIETDLPIEEAIDELGQEGGYHISGTDNVTVVDTEWKELTN